MRIALFSSAANVHTPRWVDFFTGRGHEVHLVSIERGRTLCANQHVLTGGDGVSQWKVLRSVGRARRLVREINPDVVLGQYLPSHGFLAALVDRHPLAVAAWSPDIPYAVDRHPYDRWRVGLILKRADLTLVCGRHLLDHARRLGADERRVAATYVGVDQSVFHPGDDGERDPRLVFTNREHKNILHVETLIQALPAVVERVPDARVVIANDGPRRGSLERLAEKLGVRDRCAFVGRLGPKETAEYLQRSSLYVSCSEVDGMSISLLEALACGAYPVVTDIPADREIIEAGARADLFPVGDAVGNAVSNASALAERLIARLGDPEGLNEDRRVNLEAFRRVGRLEDNLALVERRLQALVGGETFVGEPWAPGPV
jgi:glycosyltransferase involved in cell wall biosynthesis